MGHRIVVSFLPKSTRYLRQLSILWFRHSSLEQVSQLLDSGSPCPTSCFRLLRYQIQLGFLVVSKLWNRFREAIVALRQRNLRNTFRCFVTSIGHLNLIWGTWFLQKVLKNLVIFEEDLWSPFLLFLGIILLANFGLDGVYMSLPSWSRTVSLTACFRVSFA